MKSAHNLLPIDGEILYFPDFFSKSESDQFYGGLLKEISWKQEPIMMFGKSIMQPRLTAWYGDDGKSYTYSGITMSPESWTPGLQAIKSRVEQTAGTRFTSALLNQYRDEKDSVGWHRDNEKELGVDPIIGSVSFGATRDFQLQHVRKKELAKIVVPLEHGSLLLMRGATQTHWRHCIPKVQGPLGTRINITFRVIKSYTVPVRS